jgi:hypothetical protein
VHAVRLLEGETSLQSSSLQMEWWHAWFVIRGGSKAVEQTPPDVLRRGRKGGEGWVVRILKQSLERGGANEVKSFHICAAGKLKRRVGGDREKGSRGFPPAAAWTEASSEKRGKQQTGLALAATLRRIGLWAVEKAAEGRILLQARELARFVRAADRSVPPPLLPPPPCLVPSVGIVFVWPHGFIWCEPRQVFGCDCMGVLLWTPARLGLRARGASERLRSCCGTLAWRVKGGGERQRLRQAGWRIGGKLGKPARKALVWLALLLAAAWGAQVPP